MLTDNLISFWELEELSGDRADSHGTNTLSSANGVTQAAGKVGSAGQFTSSSFQSLLHATNSDFECGDISFTFCAWAYADSFPGAMILSKDDLGSNREYYLYIDSTVTQFGVFNAGGTKVANLTQTYNISNWYFFIVWHDAAADTVNAQVNDGAVQSNPTSGALNTAGTAEFRIGATDVPDSWFNGRIDQVGFWKRVLTAGERTWLYNSGSGRAYADLGNYSAGILVAWTR